MRCVTPRSPGLVPDERQPDESQAPGAAEVGLEGVALAELFVPSLVTSTLGKLGVETIADLLRLRIKDLRALHGVGKRRIELLIGVRILAETRFLHDVRPVWHTPLWDVCPETLISHVVPDAETWTVARFLAFAAEQRSRPTRRPRDVRTLARFLRRWLDSGEAPVEETPRARPVAWVARLEAAGVDTTQPWSSVVRQVPTRIRDALDRAGIESLAGMAEALDGKPLFGHAHKRSLWRLPNVGPKSLSALEDELARLARLGLEAYLFCGKRPTSIGALIEAMRATMEHRRWTALEMRANGASYTQISRVFGVSHERGRQLAFEALERLSALFGDVVQELLHDLLGQLADRLLMPTSQALALSGAESVAQLNVALLVAQLPRASEMGSFVSVQSRKELKASIQRLRAHLRAQIRAARWQGIAIDELDTMDTPLGRDELFTILDGEITELRDERGAGRVRMANLRYTRDDDIDAVLRAAGGPVHVDEIARRSQREWPVKALLHQFLDQMRSAVRCSWDEYVHLDHLELSAQEIDELQAWGAEILEEEDEIIEARILFEHFEECGPDIDGVNQYILHSLVGLHPKVTPLGRSRIFYGFYGDGVRLSGFAGKT